MKSENKNGEALQDFVRTHGAPIAVKTDCAQSELGTKWTSTCRNNCIAQETTEPHHPHQNPAEKRIGDLGSMVRRVMRDFRVPLNKHDWVQKWCTDVHNILACRSLNWRTPLEVSTGNTPDISAFRFHVWEPIWYFDPNIKQPESNLKKGRWLGFAWQAGDALTYYIETEKEKGRNMYLIRSVIHTRRKNIGQPQEYIEENPDLANFVIDERASNTQIA